MSFVTGARRRNPRQTVVSQEEGQTQKLQAKTAETELAEKRLQEARDIQPGRLHLHSDSCSMQVHSMAPAKSTSPLERGGFSG